MASVSHEKQFRAARSFCYDAVKCGVMSELVLEVLDAIQWAWDHAEARVNPASCLYPIKAALDRRSSQKWSKPTHCACGGPVLAKGFCSKCYARQYRAAARRRA